MITAGMRHVSKEGAVMHLAVEAGVPEGTYNIRVGQPPGQGYLHGGPIWGTLDVPVLLWGYDLHRFKIHSTSHSL